MNYRSEIDGLRAIAVLPVIFFHAGIEFLSGGYVGVDVFFVISGYLITTIIMSEIEQGTFSLTHFYERRARRILPALFFVMLVTLPFAWMWLLPTDMMDFSRSLIAVPTFSSNILFWQETGYWGANNELKPMLHTWSLAVEEQYYIFFPIFLMIMWKLRKNWIVSTLLVIALFSLVASHWGAYNKPTANFFVLPTRLWELAIGALIAFYLLRQETKFKPNNLLAEVLGLTGLLMIVFSILMFDETTPFPSLYTLIPTVGAGLIILFTSSKTLVGKFLSNKLFVGVGLISYSVYLWHQPLLAFVRHGSLSQQTSLTLSAVAALSIPLAYLSWKYIEKPFRTKGVLDRKTIFTFAGTASVLFIAIGVTGIKTNGFENRASQTHLTAESIDERRRVNNGLSVKCTEKFQLENECNTSKEPEILIWGDSYAMHLVKGILASKPDAKIIQMTKNVCGPFANLSPIVRPYYTEAWAQGCLEFNHKVINWLKDNKSVKYAVLSSPFSQYLSRKSEVILRNGDKPKASLELIASEFVNTLSLLDSLGIKPIIFSPPPANGADLGRCLTRADWKGEALDACNFGLNKMSDIRHTVYKFLDSLEDQYQVVRLDDFMCNKQECSTHEASTYLFRDEGHLSHEGSAHLGQKHRFYDMIVLQDSNNIPKEHLFDLETTEKPIVKLDSISTEENKPEISGKRISINKK